MKPSETNIRVENGQFTMAVENDARRRRPVCAVGRVVCELRDPYTEADSVMATDLVRLVYVDLSRAPERSASDASGRYMIERCWLDHTGERSWRPEESQEISAQLALFIAFLEKKPHEAEPLSRQSPPARSK